MAVFRRSQNGKPVWVAMINYRGYDGGKKQARRNARTQAEANALYVDLFNKRQNKELPGQVPPAPAAPATLKVGEYLDRWLAGRQGINASTAKRYRESLRHVRKAVGDVPIDELTTLQVQGVYSAMIGSGLSPQSALNVHRALKTAMQDAIDIYGLIARNPVIKQIAPKVHKFDAHVISVEELNRILAAAGETEIGPLVRLAAWTGLRLGEALALRWTDIDLDFATLTVRNTLNASGILGRPKTQRSRRTIDLSPATTAMLRQVRDRQTADKLRAGAAYNDQGFVFADALGAPLTQWGVNYSWRKVAKKAGVAARFHDLRHAHATHLLAEGWTVVEVAERLGHSQSSTTLNVYSHALPRRTRELAHAIDVIFGAKLG